MPTPKKKKSSGKSQSKTKSKKSSNSKAKSKAEKKPQSKSKSSSSSKSRAKSKQQSPKKVTPKSKAPAKLKSKQKSGSNAKAKERDTSIRAYDKKRDFERTPEPRSAETAKETTAGTTAGIYVIHRHEATRLHYDLRLEAEGVLKCFAIPKGFSHVPGVKHLAVRTEDHPLMYTEFRGMIPKGEYGGGTMLIWDEGRYELKKADDLSDALAAGEVKVVLKGRKLRGEWHLVRTKQSDNSWLLFKSKDRYARSEGQKVVFPSLPKQTSPMPKAWKLQLSTTYNEPFTEAGWNFELEFDGGRALIYKDGDDIRLQWADPGDKPDNAAARELWPEIFHALEKLYAQRAVLDGVVVVTDSTGRPDSRLLNDAGAGHKAILYLFDLLYYEEWDIRTLPLSGRKELLNSLFRKDGRLQYVDHITGSGHALGEVVKAAGLKGIIAKKADAQYKGGAAKWQRRIPVEGTAAGSGAENIDEALAKSTAGKSAKLNFSNLDKVYWPNQGYTKGQLLDYYMQVADYLLPYLRDRPLHMLRYPDGIEGKWFYQKQYEHIPEWFARCNVKEKPAGEDVFYPMVQDRASLLFLINLGSIDLHPWMSRAGSLDSPDYAFIDLDPKAAPFEHVVRLARETGKLLRGIGLTPYVKTSGKTGIHICIPLAPGLSYEQARLFCEGIARVIVRENPRIATVERSTGARGNKVYVDFLQNRREQTIVPPFVVRPVEYAQVSMPLDWDELSGELKPSDFTIENALERLDSHGDLFGGVLDNPQTLFEPIQRLQAYLEAE